jgi:oxaloacetate decarboxylase beta subunit
MEADKFLSWKPLLIFGFGLLDFAVCTFGGILTVHVMNLFLKEKINPLIGSAGVSAMPMSARVSHGLGLKADPDNWLLMHAMGSNLAGSIGSPAAAAMFLAMFE